MKIQFALILLGIGAITLFSTYLIASSSQKSPAFLSNDANCLQLEVIQVGHAYPTWPYFADNICSTPKSFNITYRFGTGKNSFVSSYQTGCIASGQKESTSADENFTTILGAEQFDC